MVSKCTLVKTGFVGRQVEQHFQNHMCWVIERRHELSGSYDETTTVEWVLERNHQLKLHSLMAFEYLHYFDLGLNI